MGKLVIAALFMALGACNMSGFKVEIHNPCIYLAENHSEPPLDPEADKRFN